MKLSGFWSSEKTSSSAYTLYLLKCKCAIEWDSIYNPDMERNYVQPTLPMDIEISKKTEKRQNNLRAADRPFHDWYRFVLSYPPHLVRQYLNDFGVTSEQVVLDPFSGTGTTIVESQLHKIKAIGVEANPFPHFAGTVKVDWTVNPDNLLEFGNKIAETTRQVLFAQDIDDQLLIYPPDLPLRKLPQEAERALITGSISPIPLHKTLILLDQLKRHEKSACYKYGLLALGNALVNSIGNLRFGPEVGVGKKKKDTHVVSVWQNELSKMADHLRLVYGKPFPHSRIHLADAREISSIISPKSIDAVITSPPYPNEKDYTRTTRLESVLLGFFTDMQNLRNYKKTLLRSNTRGVYKADDDEKWIADHAEIQRIAKEIEQRRLELGKTSGFEKLYARVTKLYFGGMARHLSDMRSVLNPGARLAYVVGDQASYLRVLIRTGELLADIADGLGYEVERIDLFRTRFATATQTDLREEVLILRWNGNGND